MNLLMALDEMKNISHLGIIIPSLKDDMFQTGTS